MPKNTKVRIDIGGGHNPKKGFLSVDKCSGAHFQFDLEKEKWLFEDCSVSEVYSQHTFEHIENIIQVMNEMWRVMEWGAKAEIRIPHLDCVIAWQDPTHKRFWTSESMKYFTGEYINKHKLEYGIICAFKVLKNKIIDVHPEIRGEETRPYLKEIIFILEKNKNWYNKNKPFYLVNKKKNRSSLELSQEYTKKVFEESYSLFLKKNRDYGNSFFESEDEKYIYYEFRRKFARIEKFYSEKNFKFKVDNETIEDTLKDLGNYCFMEIAKRRLKGKCQI